MAGRIDFVQPTIIPLYNTRSAQESLLRWSGNSISYYDYIKGTHAGLSSDLFNMSIHNGTTHNVALPTAENAPVIASVAPAAASCAGSPP